MPDFGLEITPRPDLPALVARWQREITVFELKAGYFAILDAADALGCPRWLLDLRRREELATPELTTWMNTDFFPTLPHRYAEPVRIAGLAPAGLAGTVGQLRGHHQRQPAPRRRLLHRAFHRRGRCLSVAGTVRHSLSRLATDVLLLRVPVLPKKFVAFVAIKGP